MRRSFQGLTNNVGRSMHNFMSAISSGMKSMQAGLFNRSPKHISFQPPSSSNHYQEPNYNLPSFVQPDTFPIVQEPGHAVQHVHQGVYNPDCDCTDETPFVPVDNSLDGYKETETAPAYAVLAGEEYGSPQSPVIAEEYGSPQATVITDEYGSPQSSVISEYAPVSPEPVYQPSSQYNPVPQNGQFGPTGVQPATPAPAPFTTTPGGEVYTTTLYEVPSHLSDEEICAHLKQLKEDIHRSPINHAGGSNDIDIHKLETVGVHSEHKKSSAVVPDQLHPEKYISIDCANVKRVVNQRIYYKDTKPLKANLHGKNRVRETLVI